MKEPLVKHATFVAAAVVVIALAGCKKPADETVDPVAGAADTAAAASTDAPTRAAPDGANTTQSAEPSAEQQARAELQTKLDYATMEDSYINDAKAQWATAATASSAFGDANDPATSPTSSNTPWQATGAPNGNDWTNDHQDIGFDWLQLDYAQPVAATAVRAVLTGNESIVAINKVELIDTTGAAHTVWSGLSDAQKDERGSRSWFVRTFEPTAYQVKSVKLTFANPVARGYKNVDAVQLVGL